MTVLHSCLDTKLWCLHGCHDRCGHAVSATCVDVTDQLSLIKKARLGLLWQLPLPGLSGRQICPLQHVIRSLAGRALSHLCLGSKSNSASAIGFQTFHRKLRSFMNTHLSMTALPSIASTWSRQTTSNIDSPTAAMQCTGTCSGAYKWCWCVNYFRHTLEQ